MAGAQPQQVALAGLQSQDMEIVRKSIWLALKTGLVGRPELRTAEARLRQAKQIPADWDISTYASGRFLQGGQGGRQDSTVVSFHRENQSVASVLQHMFDSTYRKVYTRDRRGAPIPDAFRIKAVYRVMNDQIWREYANHREEIRRSLRGQRCPVPDGVLTTKQLERKPGALSVLPPLDQEVNESWLFHGTTAEAAAGIAENDFRLDLTGTNAGTLYGNGIYLAENVTKSDEYGEGPKGPAGEEAEQGFEAPRPPPGPPPPLVRDSYILVCRSTLGKVRYNDQQRPNPDELQRSCLNGQYHSVMGDRLKLNGTFRELIVYHDDHVYPEYIVHYERLFFHDRFAEIYKAMMQRKKMGQFNGPTPNEQEILHSMWNVFGMPHKGRINKWQLLDLLKAISQPPENEDEDLDQTFREWDTKNDGWIDWDEFLQEMVRRIHDEREYYHN
eukprot:TRINITY_DN9532_c2_g1_i1.p1 TRINITY_DN9532_c2_g1~~TRINITY_DN9532_c2_g1_i1.p1  ORF type:complete len:480 (-),score=85.87 TRINITY_DN9532_c2_g1_i1:163-1494(-)